MSLKHVTLTLTAAVAVVALGAVTAGQVVKKEVPGITKLTEAEAIGLTNPTLRQFALDYLNREKKSGK